MKSLNSDAKLSNESILNSNSIFSDKCHVEESNSNSQSVSASNSNSSNTYSNSNSFKRPSSS